MTTTGRYPAYGHTYNRIGSNDGGSGPVEYPAEKRSVGAKNPAGFTAYPQASKSGSRNSLTDIPYGHKRWTTNIDGPVVLFVTLLCAFTRLYQIGKRSRVTWD
ncbi:hypothetical protein LPJ57_010471, partial [Coemansia sp. RSA 486]